MDPYFVNAVNMLQELALLSCGNYLQEVREYTKDAISDSIKPELTDEIVGGFDVNKPFTYQIAFDVEPVLTWKSPYKGLKVRSGQHASHTVCNICRHTSTC